MNNDVMFSSVSEEWETDPELFKHQNRIFRFDIDLAATRRNALCPYYLDKAVDYFSYDMQGRRGWLNPPFGRGLIRWVEKACDDGNKPDSHVRLLVPARVDTKYFQNYIFKYGDHELIPGRLIFNENGKPRTDKHGRPMPAPFPCALVSFCRKFTRRTS